MKTINIIYTNDNYLNIIHEVAKLRAVTGFPSCWLLTGTPKDSPLSYTPTLCSKSSSISRYLVLDGCFSGTAGLFHWTFLKVLVFSCWRNVFVFHICLRSSASYSFNVLLTIQYSRNVCFLILIWTMSLSYIKIFLKTLVAFLFYNASCSFCFCFEVAKLKHRRRS